MHASNNGIILSVENWCQAFETLWRKWVKRIFFFFSSSKLHSETRLLNVKCIIFCLPFEQTQCPFCHCSQQQIIQGNQSRLFVLSINWEWRISEIFPNSDLKNLVLVLGDFQWPSASLLPAPCADLELGSHFCFWKGKETDIMNDFYCAIFQTLLNAFEWDGNCSALCHSQNKQNIFPKPGCVFFSNWQ